MSFFQRFLFLMILVSFGCSDNQNKLVSDELDILFQPKEIKEEARSLGFYWRNHGLLGQRKQTIKLVDEDSLFHLRLIEEKSLSKRELTFEENQQLVNLADSLSEQVFNGRPVKISIVDEFFNLKYTVYQ